jgi:hypothetical protein
MPAQKVAIIYSAAIGTVRRIVLPDANQELDDPAHQAGYGERRILVSREGYDQHGAQELVNRITGRKPRPGIDDRFAVVDPDGNVVTAWIADPACHPDISTLLPDGHTLVQHEHATAGWTLKGRRFAAPPEE